jgi:prephenate dehydrogenase
MVATIGIVGLGLIGGSLARRLAPDHDVLSYDLDPSTRDAARSAGLAVAESVVDCARGRDLVVVAVPLPAFASVLPAVGGGAVVTDVASVKGPALAAARAAGVRWVGGHPMAGTERSGFGAADARLFDGAAWVLCLEDDTDLTGWLAVARLATGLGCRLVPATAAGHDAAVARISGLPHLLALTLARAGADGGPLALALAAGSFRDGTRVAGTRPELITALCEGNRAALADVAAAAAADLAAAAEALRTEASIAALAAAGHAGRQAWTATGLGGRTAPVPLAAAALLAVGTAGGHLTAVGPDTADAWLPA